MIDGLPSECSELWIVPQPYSGRATNSALLLAILGDEASVGVELFTSSMTVRDCGVRIGISFVELPVAQTCKRRRAKLYD